jgi:hypothetical protein
LVLLDGGLEAEQAQHGFESCFWFSRHNGLTVFHSITSSGKPGNHHRPSHLVNGDSARF